MKTCSKCKQEKPLSLFGLDRRYGRSHYSHCKECRKAAIRDWRSANKDSVNEKARQQYAKSDLRWSQHIKRVYGLSATDYAEMMGKQNGCCAICKRSAESLGQTLAVDHDHKTQAVRGLLCADCNRMLGCANDQPEVLRVGVEYLINAKAAQVFIESVMA